MLPAKSLRGVDLRFTISVIMAGSNSAIQFRGIKSQYRPSESVRIPFRYSAEGEPAAENGDWIGLFRESATSKEESLLSVNVGETSSHRLCDGGLWKTGLVSMQFPQADPGTYVLWYVSLKSGQVLGKSDKFVISEDVEGYKRPSPDRQTAVRSLSSSFDDVKVLEDVEKAHDSSSLALGSSFILVSEGSSCEMPGSDYVMTSLEHDVMDKHLLEGKLKKEKDDVSTSDYIICPIPKPEDLSITSPIPEPHISCVASPSAEQKASDVISQISEPYEVEATRNETEDSPVHIPQALNPISPKDGLKTQTQTEESFADISICEAGSSMMLTTSDDQKMSGSIVLDQNITDMSSSTIFIEKFVSQKEAQMLKSSNKDLRLKLRKLTEILEEKELENEKYKKMLSQTQESLKQRIEQEGQAHEDISGLKERFQAQQNELERQQRRGEEERERTENVNKKLIIEKSVLEEKMKNLSLEKETLFVRSSQLLLQLQESETKRVVVNSEKHVLQGKIDYLSAELRKLKLSLQGKNKSGETKQRAPEIPVGQKREPFNPSPSDLTVASREDLALKPKDRVENSKKQKVKKQRRELTVINGHDDAATFEQATKYEQTSERRPLYKVVRCHHPSGGDNMQKEDHSVRKNAAEKKDTLESLPKDRVEAIAGQLRGESSREDVATVECPICNKKLYSRENNYGVLLHVEHCIELSEQTNSA